MGCPLQAGALKWSHQITGLGAVFVPFCAQDRIQLVLEVTHCQFMQSGQICCCFHQAPDALSYSCSSAWSAPALARWDSSVLSIALSPWRLTQWSTMAQLWKVGLSPQFLLSAFVTFPTFVHREFNSLPHSHSPGQVQCSIPSLLSVLNYNS
jgi:hypothetical protein